MRRFEREDHLKNSLDRLELAVAGIHDSDSFRRYLDVQARFHQYSPNNILLIMSQMPEAQKVAGYRTWQSLGRQVLRGEKAIRIIAPTTYKTEEDREDEPRGIGFRSVPVFDISQTDGKPLPAFQVPLLYSDEGEELYRQLEDLATDEQVKVARGHDRFRTSRTMMGFYLPESKEIFLREAPQLQMTKTLAHELGHHFSAHTESNPSTETEAEGISYVVLSHFGLDSGERSFPYVATWAKDKNTLRAALGNIQRVSGIMIDRIEGPRPVDLPVAVPAADTDVWPTQGVADQTSPELRLHIRAVDVAGKPLANRRAQSCFRGQVTSFPANPTASRRSLSCGEVCGGCLRSLLPAGFTPRSGTSWDAVPRGSAAPPARGDRDGGGARRATHGRRQPGEPKT